MLTQMNVDLLHVFVHFFKECSLVSLVQVCHARQELFCTPSFVHDGTRAHDSWEPGAGSGAQSSANPTPGTLDKVNGDAPDAGIAVQSFDRRRRGQ